MTRRLLVVFTVLLTLAGCEAAQRPPDDGTSPLVVVRELDGLLSPSGKWRLPRFVLLGDRTAILRTDTLGIVLAGTRRTLSPAQVAELYRQAGAAGLFRDRTYREQVEDGTTLDIQVTSTTGRHETRLEQPDVHEGGDRGRVAVFAATAATFGEPAGPYLPQTAAVITYLGHGTTTDVRPWPLSTPPSGMPGGPSRPCVTVTGAELSALLAVVRTADGRTRWTAEGRQLGLLVRPLLAYEHGCADF